LRNILLGVYTYPDPFRGLSGVFLLCETVVIAVQHGGHRRHLFREQAEVELGIALLDHAAQIARGVDFPRRLVDGAAVPPDLLPVAGHAFVLGDQPGAQRQIRALKDGRHLGLGPGRQEQEE